MSVKCHICGEDREAPGKLYCSAAHGPSSFAAPTGLDAERVRAAINAEPELPGDMPDEMWEAIRNDRQAAVECMRILVRQTKLGILKRLNLEASNTQALPQAGRKEAR